jgi:hypothetical protein
MDRYKTIELGKIRRLPRATLEHEKKTMAVAAWPRIMAAAPPTAKPTTFDAEWMRFEIRDLLEAMTGSKLQG